MKVETRRGSAALIDVKPGFFYFTNLHFCIVLILIESKQGFHCFFSIIISILPFREALPYQFCTCSIHLQKNHLGSE